MSRRRDLMLYGPVIPSSSTKLLFAHGPGAVPTPWEGLKAGEVVTFDLARERDRVLLFGEAGRDKNWVSSGQGTFVVTAGEPRRQFQQPTRSAS